MTNLDEKLFMAASRGDLEEVKRLSNLKDININARYGYNKRTPLYEAAKKGHKSVVTYLLSIGADPSILDQFEVPVLHSVVAFGNAAMTQTLLLAGIKPDKYLDLMDDTALGYGITFIASNYDVNNVEAILCLLMAGADHNFCSPNFNQKMIDEARAALAYDEASGVEKPPKHIHEVIALLELAEIAKEKGISFAQAYAEREPEVMPILVRRGITISSDEAQAKLSSLPKGVQLDAIEVLRQLGLTSGPGGN